MVVWFGAAWAQSVPFGDFEAMTGWEDHSQMCVDFLDGLPPFCDDYDQSFFDASPARGAWALTLDEAYFYGIDYEQVEVWSEPFVVTHDRLTWAQTPATTGSVRLEGYFGAVTAGPASADVFTNRERDVSAACGATTYVRLDLFDSAETTVDDVALGGTPCPQFTDADLDGLCPIGTDLDADGDCADAAEFAAGADCDDADAVIGQCIDFTFARWVEVGAVHRFRMAGMPAGEEVWLAASESAGFTCPASLGGRCVNLAEPITVLGSAIADANGEARVSVMMPAWSTYAPWQFQATLTTARSAPVVGWTQPRNDTPVSGAETGATNGRFEDGVVGWPADSAGYDFSLYYGPHAECPAAITVDTPARGTAALSVGTDDEFAAEFCDGSTQGWPFLVTRTGVRFASVGDLDVAVIRLDDGTPADGLRAGPIRADDGFDAWRADLSTACGEQVWIELSYGAFGAGRAVVDGIRPVGPPCPQFVDPDGDGACDFGVDLDGDGACVSDGEPAVPGLAEIPLAHLLADFEVDPTPSEVVFTDAEAAPHHTRGARSAYIDPDSFNSWDLSGEVVTHDTLVVWATTLGVGDWEGAVVRLGLETQPGYTGYSAAVGAPGAWPQHAVDVSAVCGRSITGLDVDLWNSDWQPDYFDGGYDHPDIVLVDDLGFGGDPCPTLIDSNADGACAEGLDLDGDGLCVSTGEPTPGVVQDPTE
ncbi:MAG: hypothetical protein ABMA64_27000 [Myxococcota bacterium]